MFVAQKLEVPPTALVSRVVWVLSKMGWDIFGGGGWIVQTLVFRWKSCLLSLQSIFCIDWIWYTFSFFFSDLFPNSTFRMTGSRYYVISFDPIDLEAWRSRPDWPVLNLRLRGAYEGWQEDCHRRGCRLDHFPLFLLIYLFPNLLPSLP